MTRDRSGVYAKAVATATPGAIQVADRWHLLANCRDALERVLDRHHTPITDAMTHAQAPSPECAEDKSPSAINPLPMADQAVTSVAESVAVLLSKNQLQSVDRRAKRVARYEQVRELHRQGFSQRAIGAQLKMGRTRVMKLLNADAFPERAKTHHTQQVDHYIDPLRLKWADGIRNARELTRHIRTLGYTGGHDMVRRRVAPWRTAIERLGLCGGKPRLRAPVPLKLQRPSSDRLSWLLIKDDLERRTGETELLDELRKTCEPIRVASELARCFGEAIRNRDLNALNAWTERASQTLTIKEMKGFADGVIRNWPEVKEAVELPWSNGRTEGHVNRLKLIKRKMYGRAKLDLLRIRVVGSGP